MPSRDSRGRFKPGTTGNTKGRTPDPARRALRSAISKDMPAIIETLTQAAKSGDTRAARLLLDRAVAPLKPIDSPVVAAAGATLTDRSQAVLEAVSTGSITPNEAQTLMGVLATAGRINEIDELRQRIEAIEDRAR